MGKYLSRADDAKKEFELLESIPATVGVEHRGRANVPAQVGPYVKHKQLHQLRIHEYDPEIAEKACVKVSNDGTIFWTRDQSRLIEYVAQYKIIIKNKRTAASGPHSLPYADLHYHSLRRFAKYIGVPRQQFYFLRKFPPFWMAINNRKKEILGIERFHEVADAIFSSAISGSHADRRLYLEVFGPESLKSDSSSNSPKANFEQIIIGELKRQRSELRKLKGKSINLKKKRKKSSIDDAEYV